MYGAGLGVGWFTYMTTTTFYVVCALAVGLGDALLGAVILGGYALARTAPPLAIVAVSRDTAEAFRRYDRAAFLDARKVRTWNGIALAVIGSCLLTLSLV
jgi:hypothetical protein